jgi:hypothetical protein
MGGKSGSPFARLSVQDGRSVARQTHPGFLTEVPMAALISREELKAKMDRGDRFTLVEALPEEAYREAHIPGAINVPAGKVRELAPTMLPDKNADIVVYCAKPT